MKTNKDSILFLTNSYPDFDSSYRAIFVKKMAHLLQKEGYKISIVTPKIYRNSPCREEQNGIEVYRFPFFARNKLLIEYQKIPYLKMILYYVSGFFLTIYIILKHKSELIHVHWAIPTGLIGVWAGMLLRKPVVVTVHGSDFRMATERSSFLTRIFLYICKKAMSIMCVSELQRKEIQKRGVRAEKIVTFPMGIDENFFEVGRSRKGKLDWPTPYRVEQSESLGAIQRLLINSGYSNGSQGRTPHKVYNRWGRTGERNLVKGSRESKC